MHNTDKPDIAIIAITSQLRAQSALGEVWIYQFRVLYVFKSPGEI